MKNQIRALRAEAGLTQEELAGKLGVSRQTINAIETDRHDPSLALAFGIAGAFGVPIEAVFTASEAGPPGARATRSRATRRRPR